MHVYIYLSIASLVGFDLDICQLLWSSFLVDSDQLAPLTTSGFLVRGWNVDSVENPCTFPALGGGHVGPEDGPIPLSRGG